MTAAAVKSRAVRYNPKLRRHAWTKSDEIEHTKTCDFCAITVVNVQAGHSPTWFQRWEWPVETGADEGDTRRGGTVPKCPGPDGYVPLTAVPEAPPELPLAAPEAEPAVDWPEVAPVGSGATLPAEPEAAAEVPVDELLVAAAALAEPIRTEQAAPHTGPICASCGDPLLAYVRAVAGGLVAIEAADADGAWLAVRVGVDWHVRLVQLGEQGVDARFRRRAHQCGGRRYRCSGHGGTCERPGGLYAIGTWCRECVPRNR